MFISNTELQTHLHERNIIQITEQNEFITRSAIDTATVLVRSYLNNRYDTDTIFSQTGDSRDLVVMDLVKTIAAYKLVSLANPDLLADKYHTSYQEALEYLHQVADGTLSPDLPARVLDDGNKVGGTVSISSHPKFRHDF